MYHMIGGDGKEYGPVTADQLREWIAAGRASGETKIRPESSVEWKPLSEYPEFADALAARPTAQAQTPGRQAELPPGAPAPLGSPGFNVSSPDPDALAAQVIARNYEVDIGSVIGRAWDLLKSDFWPIVGISALILLLLSIAHATYVAILLTGPLMGGLFGYYLKRMRGQEASVNDAFSGFSQNFVQLMLGGLVSMLLTGIGFIFCVIPGIYLAVAWQLTFFLIQDRRIGFWEAMEVSRQVVTKNFWAILLLLVVLGLINLVGVLCCIVGMFVTGPLGMIAMAYLYEDLFATPLSLSQGTPGTPNDLAPLQPPG